LGPVFALGFFINLVTFLPDLYSQVVYTLTKYKNIIMKNKNTKGFTLVEIMIVVVIIGLLAAMAIPAFQKVRTTSQEKAITNNLRQLASAADQYFLEFGVTTVNTSVLVGTGSTNYVKPIAAVAGETYVSPITQGTDIQATGGTPGTISVSF
jgi:type IV pilus assembly protein PilA